MSNGVYAIVLAAGSATRFGSTKQLAEVDGASLVGRAVAAANDACDARTITVIGHDATLVADELRSRAGFVVVNEHFNEGLGSSLACAVKRVRHVASAIVVVLADQPAVSSEHIRNLLSAWSGDASEIVATAFGDTQGPPVLFGSASFDDLQDLGGDSGGKHLFADNRFHLRTVTFEPAALDIDTPEDLTQT